ncbi:MAG: 50S ribosomal protein L19 [Candidatus Omnitrophica bacterium]|nr:50S ribosomal protein L19 [Candidatus Omnitrophota bacterium]
MSKKIIAEIEKKLTPQKEIPEFWPGDEVTVYVKLKEGEKERLQAFTGTCIARKGTGLRETFTVRKVSYGEGVERTFPLYSPLVAKIEVIRTREKNKLAPRAKMYYLKEKGA